MRISRTRLILLISFVFLNAAPGYSQSGDYSFSEENRDPFVPLISQGGLILVPQEINFANLKLNGIIYSNDEPLAIINGEVLEIGAQIGDYTVSKISDKDVILKKGNNLFTLKLEEE